MAWLPDPRAWLCLDWVLLAVAAWLLIALLGLLMQRRMALVSHLLFPAGGAVSLALLVIALRAVFDTPDVAVLPLGLPGLPFHLRLDGLSAFFLMVIAAASFSLYWMAKRGTAAVDAVDNGATEPG